MSLFLKIFLWFWLVLGLMIGAIVFINWSTRTAPLARQWQKFVGEAVNLNSQTAAQIYEKEGLEGLKEYVDRVAKRRRINSIGFFDKDKKLIAGKLKREVVEKLLDQAIKTDEPQFKKLPNKIFAVKKVTPKSGKTYVYVLELRRFQPPTFFTNRLILQILSVFLIGGLFCYFLARYLTSPITKLQSATKKVAEGDFQTKVAEKVGKRRDELADLAKDFDEMAERIKSLITSEKRLTQDISHELRSPLARMNVALELARKKSNEETKPLLERLENESATLNNLIGRLLTLSKLETGSQSFEKMEVNLTKLLESIVADANFESKTNNKAVKITQKVKTKVFGNEQLLRSAIENVLRNALLYTKDETEVEVSLEKQGGKAIVSIRDFGSGVPEKDLDRLFKPFYRVQESRDRRSGGTGLGLAIAERAVNNHNGKISAENLPNGFSVKIELPILEN